jgi:hypothetical protein
MRQWPLPPNSAVLEEIRERRLTKYIGHWDRRSPAAGVGRSLPKGIANDLAVPGQRPISGAAVAASRRALHDGQTPSPLQLRVLAAREVAAPTEAAPVDRSAWRAPGLR